MDAEFVVEIFSKEFKPARLRIVSRFFPFLRTAKFQVRVILKVMDQLVDQHGNFRGGVALPVF
jgi:hypothetical protein